MKTKNNVKSLKTVAALVFLGLLYLNVNVYAHGGGPKIVPEELSVQAGSTLKVEVGGLTGSKSATFKLVGMFGKYDLGTYSIDSDDFSQDLLIPKDVNSGNYRLIVEGGGISAKIVIKVN